MQGICRVNARLFLSGIVTESGKMSRSFGMKKPRDLFLKLLKKVPNNSKTHYKIKVGIAWSRIKIVSGKGGIKMFCLYIDSGLTNFGV